MSESEVVVIRSPANATIRRLAKLRDNRRRRSGGTFLVDGWRESGRARRAGFDLASIFVPESTLRSGGNLPAYLHSCGVTGGDLAYAIELFAAARSSGRLVAIADGLVDRIGYGRSFRSVVGEFVASDRPLAELDLPDSPLVLILDSLEKPGNIGAIFRCADAAGVDAVLVTGEGCDLFNPNVIRSSLGAVFAVPWAIASEAQAAAFLERRQIRVVAARVETSSAPVPALWQAELSRPIAIVVGNEAAGLGDRWRQVAGRSVPGVSIPMYGESDSLNVSVSAALLVYEVARRTAASQSGVSG